MCGGKKRLPCLRVSMRMISIAFVCRPIDVANLEGYVRRARNVGPIASNGFSSKQMDMPRSKTSKKPTYSEIKRFLKLPKWENLALSAVEAGDYELIALPMKLEGLNAAPERAVDAC